jgi:hypothetical protein
LAPPTNFDTTRVRFGEMIAAGAGLVLILSLFLEWYSVDVAGFHGDLPTVTGWKALGFIDILLFLIGLIAIALAVMKAANVPPPRLPVSPGFIVLALGAFATLLVLFRIISIPDEGIGSVPGIDVGRSFGVFIAFLAAAAVTVGGWLTWNEEGKPKPGTPGAGAGAGGPAGAPLGQGGQAPYGGGGGAPAPTGQPQQQSYTPPAAGAAPAAAAPEAQSAPAAAGGAAKADWYPDPRGEKRLRYWDGSQWTDHTAD